MDINFSFFVVCVFFLTLFLFTTLTFYIKSGISIFDLKKIDNLSSGNIADFQCLMVRKMIHMLQRLLNTRLK